MIDVKIPVNQWRQFCESFTLQHHGWLVNLCQLDSGSLQQDTPSAHAAIQLFSDYRMLQEVREGREDDRIEILVTVGEGTDQTSFLIVDAIALFMRRIGDAHHGLRVDSRNATTTLIEFRAVTKPESLDGLAESER